MKTKFLFLVSIVSSLVFGQTGAGGVGSATNNVLWLAANKGVTLIGSTVSAWDDQSGNGNNAIPLAATNRPAFTANFVNTYPAFDFDGTNDELRVADHNSLDLTQWHIFIVVRVSTQKDYNAWLVKGNDGQENYEMLSFSDGNIHSPIYYTDGTRTPPSSAASQVTTTGFNIIEYTYTASVGRDIYKNNGAAIITDNENKTPQVNALPLTIGNEGGITGRYADAYIAEVVVYNAPLNTAQRIIVNNYLAAKYGFALTNNDVYDEDLAPLAFDHDVAGIGRMNATNLQNDSKGSGIVRILNPSNLGDNEFLMWGHDNGGMSATNTTDIPAGIQARSNRIWRVSERNSTNTADVDVGNVDIRFDLTGLGAVTATDLRLLIDADNDGVFADETPIGSATLVAGNIYQFTAVSGTTLSNNRRFTIATINSTQTPLPVALISFDAQLTDEAVTLSWQTASEINNDFFSIERSADGKTWTTLKEIKGAGNSSMMLTYGWIDKSPLAGISYYRLRQTDFDGKFTHSGIETISLSLGSSSEIRVYPNPFTENIEVQSDEALTSVRIYAADGRLVKHISGNGAFQQTISLTELPNGIYFIEINHQNKTDFRKIMKQ